MCDSSHLDLSCHLHLNWGVFAGLSVGHLQWLSYFGLKWQMVMVFWHFYWSCKCTIAEGVLDLHFNPLTNLFGTDEKASFNPSVSSNIPAFHFSCWIQGVSSVLSMCAGTSVLHACLIAILVVTHANSTASIMVRLWLCWVLAVCTNFRSLVCCIWIKGC